LPGLFLVGLLASFVVPGWRSALVPGLAVVAQVVPLTAITVGRFRYHYPIDPLMHVMAFGGLLFLWKVMAVAGARLAHVPLPSAAWRRFRGLKTAPASRKL
jgi:hypothetical protein